MADVEEAPWFSMSFYVVNVIFKRFYLDEIENARITINHGLFQCSNIRWITQKAFEHGACGLFKHLPRDPSNVYTLKTMVDPYIEKNFYFHTKWSESNLPG